MSFWNDNVNDAFRSALVNSVTSSTQCIMLYYYHSSIVYTMMWTVTHIVANERANTTANRTSARHICSFNVFTNEYLDILFAFYGQFVANRQRFSCEHWTRYTRYSFDSLIAAVRNSECGKYIFLSLSLPPSAYSRGSKRKLNAFREWPSPPGWIEWILSISHGKCIVWSHRPKDFVGYKKKSFHFSNWIAEWKHKTGILDPFEYTEKWPSPVCFLFHFFFFRKGKCVCVKMALPLCAWANYL